MAKNTKLDRRHDINAGEMLPQKFNRTEDMELHRDNVEKVLKNEADPDFQTKLAVQKRKALEEIETRKALIHQGDVAILLWGTVQVCRVAEVSETAVRVGPHWYGWELVRVPSQEFLDAVEKEVPGCL